MFASAMARTDIADDMLVARAACATVPIANATSRTIANIRATLSMTTHGILFAHDVQLQTLAGIPDHAASTNQSRGQALIVPCLPRAVLLRFRNERFVRSLIERVREGELPLPDSSPLRVVAEHRDTEGKRLDPKSAAVEVINLLRPTVAVGRFIMFAGMALEDHPPWKEKFAAGEENGLEEFVEEVRRVYPFFPFIGGRVTQAFKWQGYRFQKGDWVLLDLYGTNHDPRCFSDPNGFRPERRLSWREKGFGFIPQGGGDPNVTHRCPGEEMTVELMKEAVRLLTRSMKYDVPEQNLSFDLSRIPARPNSGLIIKNIHRSRDLG